MESVQRAMEILRLSLEGPPGVSISVTEMAAALHVSKSTVSRLLDTLAAAGFLVADPATRRYNVGPLAFAFGSRFEGAALARAVTPLLKNLMELTGCTAQFGTIQGNFTRFLSVVESNQPLRVVVAPGNTRYAHASAVGKAILASLSTGALSDFVDALRTPDGLLPRVGPGTIVQPEALEQELVLTAKRGYSLSLEETTAGVVALGAFVPSQHEPHFAVSIAFAKGLYTDAEYPGLVKTLHTMAQQMSEVLKGN